MKWFYFDDGLRVILYLVCIFACNGSVKPRPVPEDGGTVTQTGEPSHFQVDDKAAEIEVNANPAGVKVNAKPASLQVVAKPGTPAVPIFHPSIHLAQHYAPPPVVHHHPAMFYHGCFNFPCNNWFYNGIKREKFPRPRKAGVNVRTHKSDIPRAHKRRNGIKSRKRQFISAVPRLVQPSSLGAMGGLSAYGAYGYGALPQYAPLGSSLLGAYGLQQSPQTRLFAPPAQLSPQQGLQETGMTRGLVPTVAGDQGNSDVLRSYQRLYSELNSLTSMYNAILRQRSLNSAQGFRYGGALGVGGASSFNAEGSGLGYVPSAIGASQYGGATMGYGRAYVPSPLSQLYRPQSSLTQTNGLLGMFCLLFLDLSV